MFGRKKLYKKRLCLVTETEVSTTSAEIIIRIERYDFRSGCRDANHGDVMQCSFLLAPTHFLFIQRIEFGLDQLMRSR